MFISKQKLWTEAGGKNENRIQTSKTLINSKTKQISLKSIDKLKSSKSITSLECIQSNSNLPASHKGFKYKFKPKKNEEVKEAMNSEDKLNLKIRQLQGIQSELWKLNQKLKNTIAILTHYIQKQLPQFINTFLPSFEQKCFQIINTLSTSPKLSMPENTSQTESLHESRESKECEKMEQVMMNYIESIKWLNKRLVGKTEIKQNQSTIPSKQESEHSNTGWVEEETSFHKEFKKEL